MYTFNGRFTSIILILKYLHVHPCTSQRTNSLFFFFISHKPQTKRRPFPYFAQLELEMTASGMYLFLQKIIEKITTDKKLHVDKTKTKTPHCHTFLHT